jgi:two-component system chemotaxis response regulator CheB
VTAIEQQRCSSPHRANVTFKAMVVAVFPGGPKALNDIPTDFPASVLVVQRLAPDRPSLPAATLSCRTALTVKQTVERDAFRPATFFTPVPELHLLVRPAATMSQATRIQFLRPLCDIPRALRPMAATLGGW